MGQQNSTETPPRSPSTDGCKPGVCYTDQMVGTLFMDGKDHSLEMTVSLESDDVRYMLEEDERRNARISGTLSCEALSKEPVPFSYGRFYMENPRDRSLNMKSMMYETMVHCQDKKYYFQGIKIAFEDPSLKPNVTDSSKVAVIIRENGPKGATVATGHIGTKINDLAKQLSKIEITGCDDEMEQEKWKAKFGYFVGGVLLDRSKLGNGKNGRKPGVCYTDQMVGTLFMDGKDHSLEMTVSLVSDDVRYMLEEDERRNARISGTLSCEALSKESVPFSRGRFYMENPRDKSLNMKSMMYETMLHCDGKKFYFQGIKIALEDPSLKSNVTDSSQLAVIIRENGPKGATVATGHIGTKLNDLAKQLSKIEITGCDDDEMEQVKWKAKFGYFVGGVLLDTSDLFCPTQFNPQSPIRERRPLQLNGTQPEIYHLNALDGVPLVLTRFKGGNKGPLLMLHGLSVTSRIFSLDTIDKNFVEFLFEYGYDMWVLEMRFSIALKSHRKPTHINDAAENDLPPAVDFILSKTGGKDLQVICHCIGSLVMHTALLGDHVKHTKVRSMIVSQAGYCLVPTAYNKARVQFHGEKIGVAFGFAGLNAYTDDNDEWREKFMSGASNLLVRTTTKLTEHCKSPVCHRITFMYGLMWEHRNLNKLTHDTLTEWFGFAHAEFYKHLSVAFRKGRLTDIQGRDAYLPDFNSKNRLHSLGYRIAMNRLDLPTLYFVGSKNGGWDSDSTRQSYNRCKEANPSQHYEWYEIPNYGHLDCIMGQNAVTDIFPKLLPFLEKYSAPRS